ncbi:Subtilisin-like protease 6, partial [Hondaea fermentalgiana]
MEAFRILLLAAAVAAARGILLDVDPSSCQEAQALVGELELQAEIAEAVVADAFCVFDVDTDLPGPDLREALGNPAWLLAAEENAPFAAEALWHLDRINQAAPPLDGDSTAPYTGAGVTVYVLDTPVQRMHPEFDGRATVAPGNDGNMTNGHGTFVASLAAGANVGAAPRARVHAVPVLDDEGAGSTLSVLRGLAAVSRTQRSAAVILMAFSGPRSAVLERAAAALAANNILVAAAGNESG